jgi:uncharacterized protein YjbI with pentapeptide repeats
MTKKDSEIAPSVPNLPVQLSLAQMSEFHDEDCVELCLVQDCVIEDQAAENLVITQVVFKNVVFTRVTWPNLKLSDVVFEQCDLSNVDFSQCFMDRVRFRDCKLIGLNLTEASLRNVVIDSCNAAYAVLRYAKCFKSSFRKTSLTDADVYSATLNEVRFNCCNLDRIQLSGTKLAGIDLSTCQFY